MIREGIILTQPISLFSYGTIGDKVNKWGYAAVIPTESKTTGITMYSEVTILDGHWVLRDYKIQDINKPYDLVPSDIKNIRPIDKLDEINQLSFNSVMDLATELFAMYEKKMENKKIINRTAMEYAGL